MSMKDVHDIITNVRGTSSKIQKQKILESASNSQDLVHFLMYTYEPRVNFYMRKIKHSAAGAKIAGAKFDSNLLLSIVHKLSNREVRGDEAREWIATLYKSFEHDWERELLTMLIERDVKANFSANTVNKVWPDLITDVPYMRACLPKDAKLNTFPWKQGVYSQIKADGQFSNVSHMHAMTGSTVSFVSRNGSPYPIEAFAELARTIQQHIPAGFQVHGELLMREDKTGKILAREVGNGMFNSMLQKGEVQPGFTPIYEAWDMIPLDQAKAKGKYKVPYHKRFEMLQTAVGAGTDTLRVIESRVVYSLGEAYEHYRDALDRGLEGVIVKHPEMIWEDTTSKHQVKLKLEFQCELRVRGFNAGNGKHESTFGSLACESEDGKLQVNVSGFSDDFRKQLWDDRDELINAVITVKANSIMEPKTDNGTYSLFLPVFVEIRHEKKKADTIEQIKKQYEATIESIAA